MKGLGYLVSCVSVALLLVPAAKSAKDDPLLLACLVGGASLSVLGMLLRWLSHRSTQRRIDRAHDKGDAALRAGSGVVGGR